MDPGVFSSSKQTSHPLSPWYETQIGNSSSQSCPHSWFDETGADVVGDTTGADVTSESLGHKLSMASVRLHPTTQFPLLTKVDPGVFIALEQTSHPLPPWCETHLGNSSS